MSSLALSNLAALTQRVAHGQSRGMHNALKRQGIMMPALSPFMAEGTITHWKKKEGESFLAGEVLLQIENDVAIVDIEASCPGILGKILTPDGTTHVPVEAVIALVARDLTEFASIQTQSVAPTPPSYSPTPGPPSALISPRHPDFKFPMTRTPTRTPSLFEMHSMGQGHRSAHFCGPRGTFGRPAHNPPGSVPISQTENSPITSQPLPAADIAYPKNSSPEESQLDGAAIRRMIVANLSAARANF